MSMTDPHMAGQRRENNQCEDCGDDIGLLDVQGHYDGKCAKCRDFDTTLSDGDEA